MSPYGKAHKRQDFEVWAATESLCVGRDEGGYYDDDDDGRLAWRCWCAAIDAVRAEAPPPPPRRPWWCRLLGCQR